MWKDLNMKERAAFIKVAVNNGILDINDIIGHYNKFAEGGALGEPIKSYADFAKKLSIAWGGQDITKDDYDYEKYYNDNPDEAYEQLRLIQMGEAPHFPDDGKSGIYKKPSHPTYPDLGDKSWSENDTVFNISDRQVEGDTDRILNYLGSDLKYNTGSTKVKYNEGIVLPTLTVTPNARWTELVPNKYHTGWVYPDSRAADPNAKPFEYIVPNTYAKGGKINKVNPSAIRALNYFVGKGLSKEQAAGIVGNLMTESSMNTKALNPYSGAYGIAQWLGSRKTALFNKYGNNPTLDQQLDFIWHELNSSHSRGLRMLRQSNNPSDAAANAFGYYEFSAGPLQAVRAMNAAGKNTKWKNPDGTIRLNEGIKNANILLGMNPNYNPAFDRPPISSTINLSIPDRPIEIPQYEVNLALLETPRQDNQLGLFDTEPIQEQQEEPRQNTQIATLMNILDSIGKPSERRRESNINNYTIHI